MPHKRAHSHAISGHNTCIIYIDHTTMLESHITPILYEVRGAYRARATSTRVLSRSPLSAGCVRRARGRLLKRAASKDAHGPGEPPGYLKFHLRWRKARAMPAAARTIIWPSASAHAEASASADRNRLRCRSVQQKIARKRAEKYAMPETCGNRDDMHGVARKCERGMQACECGGGLTGVPNRWAEANCVCPACRSHVGDGGTWWA